MPFSEVAKRCEFESPNKLWKPGCQLGRPTWSGFCFFCPSGLAEYTILWYIAVCCSDRIISDHWHVGPGGHEELSFSRKHLYSRAVSRPGRELYCLAKIKNKVPGEFLVVFSCEEFLTETASGMGLAAESAQAQAQAQAPQCTA
eukprot:2182694-Rhodomonas_salina.1